jgi:hypothetical protein
MVEVDDEPSPVDAGLMLSALNQVPLILMVCEGPDLTVAGFSAATRALMPRRSALGRPLREVFHELDGQGFLAAYVPRPGRRDSAALGAVTAAPGIARTPPRRPV